MSDSEQKRGRGYFSYEEEVAAFNRAFGQRLGQIQKTTIANYLNPENVERFRHGGKWKHPSNAHSLEGELQTHSTEMETKFDEVVSGDIGLISRSFAYISEDMHRQFAEMFYSTISEACDRSGNIIDAKTQGSIEATFMAAIERIPFVADKNGKVNLPEIHVNPETGERIYAALKNAPPEYQERLEALKARKTEEALACEAERKAKFVRYGDKKCD